MSVDDRPGEATFVAEVRRFIKDQLAPDIAAKTFRHERLERSDYLSWHQALHQRGWGAPMWPAAYGGPGWSPMQQHLFDVECALAGAPGLLPFGLQMVAPVIMKFGNDWQKQTFLPKIPSLEHWWCQGYSEPGSGSDLASLKTRAERRGDRYVVNGQKTWTTLAHYANWIFLLARTSTEARKQDGISFLLCDMSTPGITLRPLITLDEDHEVNEVFFDNVEVPVEHCVGAEGQGWACAKYLLEHERTSQANIGGLRREFASTLSQARALSRNGRPLIEDTRYRDALAETEIAIDALEYLLLEALQAEEVGAVTAALLKIRSTELQQTLGELQMRAVGAQARPFQVSALRLAPPDSGPLAARYFNLRKTTIYGGSNEIQRNIIAQRGLGL